MAGAEARRLLPTEVARLLNSTPLGPVTTGARVRRHVEQAGYRIGDGRTVDLLRYAAWLMDRCHGPSTEGMAGRRSTTEAPGSAYASKRAAMAAQSKRISRFGRDIGALPPPADAERRAACARDLRMFCETYTRSLFPLAWSDDHLRAIHIIETAVIEGGLFAFAMPRGSGKTTLVEVAVQWAALYGHRRFTALIGCTESHAEAMLRNIESELSTNDLLIADFPAVCVPLERLEGIAQRARGQLCQGQRTHVEWGQKVLVLPSIPGSSASGGIIRVAGITGTIRGMSFRRPDGTKARPDFVVLDDPQTDESARSPSQCRQRLQVISGAILGLAGPGAAMSGFAPCTVVRPGDLADTILDREKHPEWQGERYRMVYTWPQEVDLWEEYARLRRESFRNGGRGENATGLYRRHRRRMDKGAVVAWPARMKADELSALQHAWNLRIDRGEQAFAAEYQNDPLPEDEAGADELTAEQIAARTGGAPRGVVPADASHLTMFVDVQGRLLYWLVAAWRDDFTGQVVDYGSWPAQKAIHFTLRDARRTLREAIPGAGLEGAIAGGLAALFTEQLGKEFRAEDGSVHRISRCLVDANWGDSTDVVYQTCRRSIHAGLVMPSHGRFVGPQSTPMSEYRRRPGDRVGLRWRVPGAGGKRATRHVLFDANWWKSFIRERLSTAVGDPGALTLFGAKPDAHRMLADHLVAERRVPLEAFGRKVDTWQLRQPGLDNHLLDCLVGAAVAASMQGATLAGLESAAGARGVRQRLRLSDIQRARR